MKESGQKGRERGLCCRQDWGNVSPCLALQCRTNRSPIGWLFRRPACLWASAGFLSALLLGLIAAYRAAGSHPCWPPLPLPFPSCSAYGIERSRRHWPLAWRLAHPAPPVALCHPFHPLRLRSVPGLSPLALLKRAPTPLHSALSIKPPSRRPPPWLPSPRITLFKAVEGCSCAPGRLDRLARPAAPAHSAGGFDMHRSSPEGCYDLECRYWPWAEAAGLSRLPRVSSPAAG